MARLNIASHAYSAHFGACCELPRRVFQGARLGVSMAVCIVLHGSYSSVDERSMRPARRCRLLRSQSGAKRTWRLHREMSAFDPKRTSEGSHRMSAWCPKGQFISRRVDVKMGGLGEHGG